MSKHRGQPAATDALNPRVAKAAKAMSAALTKWGVPHAVVGGLAIRANGYSRSTRDADFLVSADADDSLGGDALGGEVRSKSIHFQGVDVNLLFPGPHEQFLEAAIRRAKVVYGLPTIPQEALVYMKLAAGRTRDSADVVEMAKRGRLDEAKVRAYLKKHRPDLVEDFASLCAVARCEAG